MNFGAKQIKVLVSVTLVLLMIFSISFVSFATADTGVPNIISYQGHLTDSGGNLLGGVGTPYYFRFSFYDSPTIGSGNKVWPASSPSSVSLIVKQGSFNVDIGDTSNGYPDTLNYNFNSNQKVYLQIEISSDNSNFETLSPRSPITSAPFSQVSSQVNGTGASSFGTTTPITNSLISAITTGINQVAMTIRGAVGQVANLFNITDSNGSSVFSVGPTGAISASSSLTVYGPASFYNTLNAGTSTISNLTLGSSGALTSLLGSGLSNISGTLTVSTSTIQSFFSTLGSGLSYNASTGAFTNTGVTALGGTTNQINVSGMTGTITLSLPQNIDTGATPTFASTTLSNFTAGSIPFFGAGGVLSQNNSNLFWDNTNGRLGIGTTSPSNALGVVGNGYLSGKLGVGVTPSAYGLQVAGTGYFSSTVFAPTFAAQSFSSAAYNNGDMTIITKSGYGINFEEGTSSTMYIKTGGNVGIGTTSPSNALEVVGNGYFSGNLTATNITATGTFISPGGVAKAAGSSNTSLAFLFGNTPTLIAGGGQQLRWDGSSLYASGASIGSASTPFGNGYFSGNVGIGTTTLSEALSVAGNINLTGALKLSGSAGTLGQLLQTTGTGLQWVATSSLGFSSSQWTTSGSNISFGASSGSVGIGTTTPSTKLDIFGNSQIITNSLGATQTATSGLLLVNNTPATNGTTQLSPALTWSGTGYTSYDASAKTVAFRSYVVPVQTGTMYPTGYLSIGATIGTGSYTNDLFKFSPSGEFTSLGSIRLGPGTGGGATISAADSNSPGSFAGGNGNSGGVISASASGAFAFGFAANGTNGGNTISASGGGSVAFGYAKNRGITSSGSGSFAGGYTGVGTVTSGGQGSFAWGDNLSVSGNNQVGFGSGFTNTTSNSFMVGYGATPTLVVNGSNLGIGSTTPSAQLTTTGTVRFSSLTGAGSNLIVDSLGNVTVSSDERLKNIDNMFTRGLNEIEKINPITFHWRPETGYDTTNSYTGFSAQNIQSAIPEAVATNSSGYLTLADRPILATLVNAVKEIANKIDSIMRWFSSDGSKFNVSGDVCVDNVCVTKDQFKNMLQNAGGTTKLQVNLSTQNVSEQQPSTSNGGTSSSGTDTSTNSSSTNDESSTTPPVSPSSTDPSPASTPDPAVIDPAPASVPPPIPSPIETPAVVPPAPESPTQSPTQN